MRDQVAIYLAGNIQKGHEKPGESYWTEDDLVRIEAAMGRPVTFLNPAERTDDLSDNDSVFGRDMLMVFSSHCVFVDARERRGLGVGAEMMWAKLNAIPVVTWTPRNTHYRKDSTTLLGEEVINFVHPFVECLSDKLVETVEEGAQWIAGIDESAEIKGVESIGAAMEYYKATQLEGDEPMRSFVEASDVLKMRINRAHPKVAL